MAGAAGEAPPFDRERMLQLLRHVPQPVVVVTVAVARDCSPAGEEPHDVAMRGITCSSFCSISMEPPLLSVCIHRKSPFLELVQKTPVFAIHLMNNQNKALADSFAKKHPDLNKHNFGSHAGVDWSLVPLEVAEEGKEAAARQQPALVPLLKGTQSALACRRTGLLPHGDHFMLLGEVVAHADGVGEPLIYMDRKYWSVGAAL